MQIFILNDPENRDTLRIMTGFGISGAIILDEFIGNDILTRLGYSNIPVVVCDRDFWGDGVSSITLDNYQVSCQVMDYLVETGHRTIGYLQGTITNPDNVHRFTAYRDTLAKHGLPYREEYVLQGNYHSHVAYQAVDAFLKGGIPLPQAFFCANDNMAVGCIKALNEGGVRVPEDISIIGFDDDDSSQYLQPKLTTVAVESEALGQEATQELIRLIHSKEVLQGVRRTLPGHFIERESVKRRN